MKVLTNVLSVTIAEDAICLPFGLLFDAHLVEVVTALEHFNVLLIQAEVLVAVIAQVLL